MKFKRVRYKIKLEVWNVCVVSINVPEEILLDLHEDKKWIYQLFTKNVFCGYLKTRKYHWNIVPILQE